MVGMALFAISALGFALTPEFLTHGASLAEESCCCHALHNPAPHGAKTASPCACHVCPSTPHLFAIVSSEAPGFPPQAPAFRWMNDNQFAPGFLPEPATPPPRAAA
jgi:hypothetical protein